MEVNILEDSKNKFVFEIKGEGNALCNLLTKSLWNVNGVKISGYNIAHPLVGIPKVVVETDSKTDPRKAVLEACKTLSKDCDNFIKAFNKEVK